MKLMFGFLLALLLASTVHCKKDGKKSQNIDPVNPTEYGLPETASYNKIFDITEENHFVKIMKSEDAWIVVFYNGQLHAKWKQLAKKIGGAVWFGAVDAAKNIETTKNIVKYKNINLEGAELDGGLAAIYPFGIEKKREAIKKEALKVASRPREAELLVSATIPDRSTDLHFTPRSMEKFNSWVVDGYYGEQPPKFPVVCITDDTETPVQVKVLSYYFNKYFQFGIVHKPDIPDMQRQFAQVPEPKKYPGFLLLLGREPSSEEMNQGVYNMHFNIMNYIDMKYGEPSRIESVINFLYTANDDYRTEIPGRRSDESKEVSTMKAITDQLKKRVQIVFGAPKKKSKKPHIEKEKNDPEKAESEAETENRRLPKTEL